MIILGQNNKIQIESTAANLDWAASWSEAQIPVCQDVDCEPCFVDGEDKGQTTNGTVDAVPVPTTNTNQYQYSIHVKYISVYNDTAGSATITVKIDESGTDTTLMKIALPQGYQLIYNAESGWQVLDPNGAAASSVGAALTSAHIFVGNGSNIATDVAMSGEVSIDNTGATTVKAIMLHIGAATTSLTNATGYVFGSLGRVFSTAFGLSVVPIPFTGTITRIFLSTTSTANGTTGQTINLYKNGVSQGAITTTWNTTSGAVRILDITGLSVLVTASDYIELQSTVGANATNVTLNGYVFMTR